MKHSTISIRRCCRKAGGLNFGFVYHFPISILDFEQAEHTECFTLYRLNIGLLFWEVKIALYIKRKI